MPTGYTADVGDGKVTELRTFALRCARAFGAAVTQRDDPMDEEPKHREESTFHVKELAKADVELARLLEVDMAEAGREMVQEAHEIREREARWQGERREQRERYESMLEAVGTWLPPTPDHDGLKEFMQQQLNESIKHDCYTSELGELESDVHKWLLGKRIKAVESLAYSHKSLLEEQERVRNANAWIDALYESLEPVSA